MKCHYDVLGISQNASDEDIRKAYRKLALRWHPDKNLDNPEEAKEQFLLVQQAFELLSDPHERAWYDKRRDEILRGHSKDGYVDNSLDLFQFFNPCAFRGYNDDEKGFYTVFRNVFITIAKEEMEFSRDFDAPEFGRSDSSYDKVVHPFYSFWQSFVTKKSFSWLDPIDTKSAPNRAVLRLIEKENKKVRDKARKQRNEEVRALVAFVRKRDKRVQAHVEVLKEKAMENQKKMEEHRLKRIEEQNKAMLDYKESEWSKLSELELRNIEATVTSQFGEDSATSSSDSERENTTRNLYCSVCNKLFKSIKQFMNHEQSKKHREKADRFQILVKTSPEEEESVSDEAFEIRNTKPKIPKSNVITNIDLLESDSELENYSDDESEKGKSPVKSFKKKWEGLLPDNSVESPYAQSSNPPLGKGAKSKGPQKTRACAKKVEPFSASQVLVNNKGGDKYFKSYQCEDSTSSCESGVSDSTTSFCGSPSISLSTHDSGTMASHSIGTQAPSVLGDHGSPLIGLAGNRSEFLNDDLVNLKGQPVHVGKNILGDSRSLRGDIHGEKLSSKTRSSVEKNTPNEDSYSDDGSSDEESDLSAVGRKTICEDCHLNPQVMESCLRCLMEAKKKKAEQRDRRLPNNHEEGVAPGEILDGTIENFASFNSHTYNLASGKTNNNGRGRTDLHKSQFFEVEHDAEIKSKNPQKTKKKQKKMEASENPDKPLNELLAELNLAGLSKKQRKKLQQQSLLLDLIDDSDDDVCPISKKDSKKRAASKQKSKVTCDESGDEKYPSENTSDKSLKAPPFGASLKSTKKISKLVSDDQSLSKEFIDESENEIMLFSRRDSKKKTTSKKKSKLVYDESGDEKYQSNSHSNKCSKTAASKSTVNTSKNKSKLVCDDIIEGDYALENFSNESFKTATSESSDKFPDYSLESANGQKEINSGSNSSLHQCLGCDASFKSKNKLFEHLRQTKHALPVAKEVRPVRKTKAKSRRQC